MVLSVGVAASANERAALVIGNAAYEHVPPLVNPRNDAEDMAGLLRRLGFVVTEGLDLTDAAMEERIRAFARQAKAAEVALLFYAGHGMQVGGVNYLLPVDARLADEADLPFEAVALDLVLRSMGTGTNLVFLDACRDNPFIRTWAGTGRSVAGGRGLTRVGQESASGMFIAFATDPDSIAADGEGRNSPFTAALKRHIETPGLEVNSLLTEVRRTVLASTGNMQRPWSNSSLSAEFYFVPPSSQTPRISPRPDSSALDPAEETWLQIRDTTSVQTLEGFLATFPNSPYRIPAEARLERLRGAPFTVETEPAEAHVRFVGQASVGEPFRDQLSSGGEGPLMVVVPSGSFAMGPKWQKKDIHDEAPVDRVFQAPFAVGVFHVTFAEWDACVDAGGCGGYRPRDHDYLVDLPGLGWGRGARPVINVSWNDASSYTAWLSRETGKRYRLLSESEWEYAARAGTRTRYSWGDNLGFAKANCEDCGVPTSLKPPLKRLTVPVGSFEANPWGLHDMPGNVQSWVEDCWNDDYAMAPLDGSAWGGGSCREHVVRGSSYLHSSPSLDRRGGIGSSARSSGVGFRVARTLAP